MSPYVSSKLGQVTLGIFAITGTSLLIANILSLSSSKTAKEIVGSSEISSNTAVSSLGAQKQTNSNSTHQATSSFARLAYSKIEIPPIQHKKCQVVLTSKDQNHEVVACRESSGHENWYLFNTEQNSLEKIDGLTAKNDTGWKPLEDTASYWKDKKWQGYRGRESYRDWGKEVVGTPFDLQYVSEETSFKFPFYDYLGIFCKSHKWWRYKGFPFPITKCTQFDIPVSKFRTNHLIKSRLKQAFGEEKQKCFIGNPKDKRREFNWQETGCNSLLTKK